MQGREEIMKIFGHISLIFLLALSLLTGCEATRSFTSSISGSSDENLLAQVPAEEREEVKKAEFDLQVAQEKMSLAEMKTELASLQKKYADYEEDAADEYQKKAEVSVELAKLEAIDRAGLGEKQANIEDIADLKAKQLKIEANKIKIEAKRDTTGEKINDLRKQIEEQETKIMNLEAAGVPEPEKADVMTTDEKPAEKGVSESATEKGAGEQEGQQ
jgi:chromosome segregation ATPase